MAAACLAVAAVVDRAGGDRPVAMWLVAVLGIALFVANALQVQADTGDAADATTLVDLVLIPLMIAVPLAPAVVITVVGATASEVLLQRRPPLKGAFNVAWMTVAVFVGGWLAHGVLSGSGQWRSVLAASVAAVSLLAVNLLAFSGVVVLATARSLEGAIREELAYVRDVGVAMAGTGALAGVLALEAPAALPLLAVFVLTARTRAVQRSRVAETQALERDRLQRTVEGASDGIALLDSRGVVEVWNPAMARLTGVPADAARGRPLERVAPSLLAAEARREAGGSASSAAVASEIQLGARTVAVRVASVRDRAGRRTGQVLSLRDMTRERELDGLHEDLVSRVSHELRTPLTTVLGFLESLDARWDSFPEQLRRQQINVALRASRRLRRLVGDLLIRSGVEHRSTSPRPVVLDVRHVVADVLEELRDVLPSGVVRYDSAAAIAVEADADHVHQILGNLLANAATYGAPPIEVEPALTGDMVAIRVRDHGPGVPTAFVPRLFESFTQASTGDRRTARGLGLGLAVVRELAQANRGSVTYEPTPGGGATFVVALPAPRAEGDTRPRNLG